jgi:hypothetical protein
MGQRAVHAERRKTMKNRIIAALIVIAFAFSITGCSEEAEALADEYYNPNSIAGETEIQEQLKCIAGNNICSEWVDTVTGVHYYYTYKGGLELRVNADGTPYTD